MRLMRAVMALVLAGGVLGGPWATLPGHGVVDQASAGTTAARTAQRAHAAPVVLNVSPPAGAVEVPRGGLLAVQFDRPMVPLAAIGAAGRQVPVQISPPVAVRGRWVGTSLWALSGAGGLAGATVYTVRVPAGLRAVDGTVLASSRTWSFETARPAVLSTSPQDRAQNVAPRANIDITFNQPVVRASAMAAASIAVDSGGAGSVAPAGHWTWRNQTMTFHPAAAWPMGARVAVRIAATVRAAGGGPLPMAQPASLRFTVARALRVSSTSPPSGATGYATDNGISVFFTAPVDPNTAQAAVAVRPTIDSEWVDVSDDGLSLSVGGAFHPATHYTITVSPRLRALYGGHLPAPVAFSFTTAPAEPSVSFYNLGPVATFDVYRTPTLYARAVNVSTLHYALYRSNQALFVRMSSPSFDWSKASRAGMATVRRWAVPVHAAPNKPTNIGQRLLAAGGAPLPAGYYYLTVSDGASASDQQLLLITATGLTLKVAQRGVLLWATDLKSGLPVAGLPVRVVDDRNRSAIAGRTGSDGVFAADGLRLRGYGSLLDAPLVALARGPSAAALAWNSGISPWDYNLPFVTSQPAHRIYVYTERPIYRPGQSVYFRGVVRADDDGRYTLLPAGTFVRVTLNDALGHAVFSRYYHLSAAGTFDGHAALGAAASLGGYDLTALVGADTGSAGFAVQEYQKPSFALTVTPDRGEGGSYVQGDRISVRARATYYFGAALGHAPVAWSVLSDDYFFAPDAHSDYDFEDFDAWSTPYQASLGNLVTQGSGTTNASGTATFGLRADTSGHPLSQQLTIEASVGSASHETVAERTQVVVHKGAYYLGLRPGDVVAGAGQPQRVDLLALRPDGVTLVGGVAVTMRVYLRTWYSVYMRDPSTGNFLWQTRPHDALLSRQVVHTDGAGAAALQFTPAKGGEYRVTADAVDGRGNAIHTATYLWAGSDAYTSWGFQNNDRLRLVADRQIYHSGDVAHVLVPAPLQNMLALVTVERGRVMSHHVQRLHGNSVVLDVPITAHDVPDVYVSVVLAKGTGADSPLPTWKMGYLHLAVDEMEKALQVTITPDRSRAGPGQRVTFGVHTADHAGRPVSAEVSLALVDAAVLALAQDQNASILDAFYADRELGVETGETLALFVDRINLAEGLGAKGGSGGGAAAAPRPPGNASPTRPTGIPTSPPMRGATPPCPSCCPIA
jgi:uncharacterized protein YfaS (alpha-2-macroglobulin family)